ncbi:MAG: hypothetical protein ACLSHU_08075 [Oscillospiraceae bacterium]
MVEMERETCRRSSGAKDSAWMRRKLSAICSATWVPGMAPQKPETVFRCQMWQKAAAVLPGVNFNLCGKARQGQGAQSPAYGRQLRPAPQAQVARSTE